MNSKKFIDYFVFSLVSVICIIGLYFLIIEGDFSFFKGDLSFLKKNYGNKTKILSDTVNYDQYLDSVLLTNQKYLLDYDYSFNTVDEFGNEFANDESFGQIMSTMKYYDKRIKLSGTLIEFDPECPVNEYSKTLDTGKLSEYVIGLYTMNSGGVKFMCGIKCVLNKLYKKDTAFTHKIMSDIENVGGEDFSKITIIGRLKHVSTVYKKSPGWNAELDNCIVLNVSWNRPF